MTADKYNGWANYPTWNAALWLDNSQGDQEYWAERVNECADVYELAQEMQEMHDQYMHELCAGMMTSVYGDLLTWASGMIEWHEIAQSYWDDWRKQEEEEEEEEE